jgi:hypothetical protein
MSNVTFKCHHCKKLSSLDKPAQERDVIDRLVDASKKTSLTFYCVHCDWANEVPMTPELMMQFLLRQQP